MATYKSSKETIAAPAERVYEKLSDLENLRNVIENIPEDKIPADKRGMMEQIKITSGLRQAGSSLTLASSFPA